MSCKYITMNNGLRVLLDDVDYDYFINFTIHSTKDGYVVYTLNGKKTYVHRKITGAKDGEIVDHKNRDTLDNRRENLRVTSHSMNHANVKKYNIENPTSKYKGVFFDKANQNWVCKVGLNNEQYFNGRFTSELAAAHAYNFYATQAFGEFSLVNELPCEIDWKKYQLIRDKIEKQSGYNYVFWDKSKGKWLGKVTKEGKQKPVCSGLSEIDTLLKVNQFILDNHLHKLKKYKKNLQPLSEEDMNKATESQLLILKRQIEKGECNMKLLKIEQPSCNPCKFASNFLTSQNVEFETVDATENPEVASQYGIMSVPVTILLDDKGNEVARSNGFKPDELEEIISKLK